MINVQYISFHQYRMGQTFQPPKSLKDLHSQVFDAEGKFKAAEKPTPSKGT